MIYIGVKIDAKGKNRAITKKTFPFCQEGLLKKTIRLDGLC